MLNRILIGKMKIFLPKFEFKFKSDFLMQSNHIITSNAINEMSLP